MGGQNLHVAVGTFSLMRTLCVYQPLLRDLLRRFGRCVELSFTEDCPMSEGCFIPEEVRYTSRTSLLLF